MTISVYDRENLPEARPRVAIAIGTFDGVHLGHRHILERLRKLTDAANA